jgi:hypothetical protein
MSTTTEDRIAALKAQIAQARVERNRERTAAAAEDRAARLKLQNESRARRDGLADQLRTISGGLKQTSASADNDADERRHEAHQRHREEEAAKLAELSRSIAAVRLGMDEARTRREEAEEDSSKGTSNLCVRYSSFFT